MAKQNVLTRGKKARAEQLALSNRLVDAKSLYQSVCKIDPMDVEAWVKLGVIQCRLGQYADAESSVRRALMLAPDLAFAQHTLATVLQNRGKTKEASALLERTVDKHPDSVEHLLNLARLRENQGHVQEAFDLYHRILGLLPESAYVLAKQGELLEKAGRLEEARETLSQGLSREPAHPLLNLVAARLERRDGQFADAATRLESLLAQPLAENTRGEALLLLGQIYDRLGKTEQVLHNLTEGKRRMAAAVDPDGLGRRRFMDKVDYYHALARYHTIGRLSDSVNPADVSPIFLIGFPRSGTTLLEQILGSHPALCTMEEKPSADALEQAFLDLTGGGIDALDRLEEAQIVALRHVYWEEAARHASLSDGVQLVDKLPLNTVRIPLLWRIFPEARFILAIRHPCDVTLSCLMQNFAANDAMVGFTTLHSVAEIYARVMGAWSEFATQLPLHWQRIRYEDIVANFEPEARRLFDFLGVSWDDAVLDHTRHAQTRGIINTPSYHQVTQPIYQHARYRWKRYEQDFAPVLATLQPYIEHFGYDDSP